MIHIGLSIKVFFAITPSIDYTIAADQCVRETIDEANSYRIKNFISVARSALN
jgi:hypothetical protein